MQNAEIRKPESLLYETCIQTQLGIEGGQIDICNLQESHLHKKVLHSLSPNIHIQILRAH